MKRIAHKYVEFVRQPDVTRLLLTALVSRMPVGMVGFSMLMFLREAMGNFALAGSAVGSSLVAMAITAPVWGRIIDRQGPARVLLVTGIIQPLALLATLFAARLSLPFPMIAGCAMVAGAFASPITTLTRTIWRNRFSRDEDRRTAFALDSVTIEMNFTAGPAIVAAVLVAFGATAAFATAIAMVVFSWVVFMLSGALRFIKRSTSTLERHLLGPLTERKLVLLFLATFGHCMSFGLLEIGYPAYATALGLPALAGILLAINSLGSAIGGGLYGGLHFKWPVERQFALVVGLMAFPLIAHAALVDYVVPFAFMAFIAGMLIAPSIAAQSVLVSRFAPSHYATEAFTWSSTFIVAGLGAGMALGGFLVETEGLRFAFCVGSAIVATMALLALAITPGAAPAAAD
ncbi:MAG: MFS transporter [Usitatibacter sp.]